MISELIIFIIGISGCLFLSQVTVGVGIIAFGCCCGIVQRLALSRKQHAEIVKLLKQWPPELSPKEPKT